MAAMAQATRLTRQGRVEATALIQQTLASPAVTRRPPDAPHQGRTLMAGVSHPAPPAALRQARGHNWGRSIPAGLPAARSLAEAAGVFTAAPPAAPAMKRPAGRFDAFCYTNAASTRAYRLYLPAGYTGGSLPLVVMLHGGTQDAATFAAATGMNDLAERRIPRRLP